MNSVFDPCVRTLQGPYCDGVCQQTATVVNYYLHCCLRLFILIGLSIVAYRQMVRESSHCHGNPALGIGPYMGIPVWLMIPAGCYIEPNLAVNSN